MASSLAATGVGGAAGGGLPPDNGFGLFSLTTTRSGTFQADTVTKTGAVLRWWWGDGTYTDGNNPVKVYPNNSKKTIYIATTDGWSGLTDFRCLDMSITSSVVSVATSLQYLWLFNNILETPPDISTNTELTRLYLHNNILETPPDTSTNTKLTRLYLHNNILETPPDISTNTELTFLYLDDNNLTTPPDTSTNTELTRLYLHNNILETPPDTITNTALTHLYLYASSLDAAGLSAVIDDCYANRAVLGSNGCQIRIEDNAEAPNADTIAKIEGTGIYAGDGLKDNGCSVTY